MGANFLNVRARLFQKGFTQERVMRLVEQAVEENPPLAKASAAEMAIVIAPVNEQTQSVVSEEVDVLERMIESFKRKRAS